MIFGATPPPSNALAAIMLFYLIWLVLEGFYLDLLQMVLLS